MMKTIDFAISAKNDLVEQQIRLGIPAMWMAAQFCHESDHKGNLSELATLHNNFAGLKWAEWQRDYGCKPVVYGTWEVIDGNVIALDDAFCSCQNWFVWLDVYTGLLTGSRYLKAIQYAYDPFLYGSEVWVLGWATDPNYLVGTSRWMKKLWSIYQDTIYPKPAQKPTVSVQDKDGKELTKGWLEGSKTAVYLREYTDGLGYRLYDWDGVNRSIKVKQEEL